MTDDDARALETQLFNRIRTIVSQKRQAEQQPVDQHHIPKSYQKRFCGPDGTFHLFNLTTKRYYYATTPGRVGKRPHLYTLQDENGKLDYSLEHLLSVAEENSKPVIDKVIAGQALNTEDRFWLSFFWGAMFCRTPDLMESYRHLHKKGWEELMRRNLSDVETAEKLLKRHPPADPTITAKELVEFVRAGEHVDEVESDCVLASVMRLLPHICHILASAEWHVYRAPPGISFITTDNPVILLGFPGDMELGHHPIGFNTRGVAKVLPLSPTVCLLAGPPGTPIEERQVNHEQVSAINLCLAREARGLIISADKKLLANLVTTSNAATRSWSPAFQISFGPPTGS